jgi:hypothetical protein
MIEGQIMEVMQWAADKLGPGCSLFPYGVNDLEVQLDGWCCLGWIKDFRTN